MLKRLVAVSLITGCLVGIIAFTGCGHSSISTSTPTTTPAPSLTSSTPTPIPSPTPSPTPKSTSKTTYTLTLLCGTGGTVWFSGAPYSGGGPYIFDSGQMIILKATPNPGYLFEDWTGDTGTIANVNNASATITMTEDKTIMANFAPTYELLVGQSGAGSTTPFGGGEFLYNQVVSIVATAAPDTQFVGWTGDTETIANTSAASTTIRMKGNYNIQANFAAILSYTLSIVTLTDGYGVNPFSNLGGTAYFAGVSPFVNGSVIPIYAVPSPGYKFWQWQVDSAFINTQNTTVTITGNTLITAYFMQCVPEKPQLTSPPSGSYMNINRSVNPDIVDLDWTMPFYDNVKSYNIYLGNSLGEMQKVASVPSTSSTVFHCTSLLKPGETYYWKVSAVGWCGENVSEVRNFTTTP